MNMHRISLPLFASVLLVGCNPVKSTAEAEKAVADFHARFDAQDFDGIFDAAHPDFKSSQPKQDVIAFIKSVREKLGAVKSASRTGWQANSYNLNTNVVLTYTTRYENGTGTETFTYRVKGGSASLLGWHINSNDLLMTPPTPAKE